MTGVTRVSVVTRVSMSDLRQNLPAFLKRVQAGEQLQITSRGQVIARIAPECDPAEEARQWLLDLRDRVSLGDVVHGLADLEWSGDAVDFLPAVNGGDSFYAAHGDVSAIGWVGASQPAATKAVD